MDTGQRERNRAAQVALYGAPLGDLCRHLMTALGLTQAQLATTIGLSAPMLSQLMSAQRVKIGNPAAVQRMQAMSALVDDVEAGRVSTDDVGAHLDEIRTVSGILTTTSSRITGTGSTSDADLVATVRGLLRAVASGHELHDVAASIASEHPGLAELIRTYGVGTVDDALDHYARHKHLL